MFPRLAPAGDSFNEKSGPALASGVQELDELMGGAVPGAQTIRVVFDEPQRLKHISLVFEEEEMTRTQEFVLRASSDAGGPFRDIARQQWNFSAPTSTQETEEYQVELPKVSTLELTIVPDISDGTARASLKSLRLS